MINNNRYTSYLDIWARLSRVHTTKQFSPNEVIEWCAEVEHDILEDIEGFALYKQVPLVVNNLQALLPCNLFRLMEVFISNDRRIKYSNQGDFIMFDSIQTFNKNNQGQDIVYISYYGIPVDPKTGYPLIKKGHELACEAYCTWKVYYEDFLIGKIDANRWSFINQQKENELNAAMNGFRHWDKAQLEQISIIKMNMIPRIGQIPMMHLEWDQQTGFVNSY